MESVIRNVHVAILLSSIECALNCVIWPTCGHLPQKEVTSFLRYEMRSMLKSSKK